MRNFLVKLWNRSIKYQILIVMGLGSTSLIVAFTYFVAKEHNDFLKEQAIKEAKNRSLMLATNSKIWVVTNDYAGLQEVINNLKIYDDLIFASVIDMDGKIIAHTNHTLIGQYIADKKRIDYLEKMLKPVKVHTNEAEIFERNDKYIDLAQIIHQGDEHVGWVHFRINQTVIKEKVNETMEQGIIFIFIFLGIGILLSFWTANSLTKQLFGLINTMKQIGGGNKDVRASEGGISEISEISHAFNVMLETIKENEHQLEHSQEQLRKDIKKREEIQEEIRTLNENLESIVQSRTEELVIEKERAESANKSKSIFLSNMSHELRTPLNAILGFSHIMRDATETTPSQKEKLDIIENSGNHLLSLINDILDMSKIEAGKMELDESDVDIHKVLHEISDMLQIRADNKELQYTLEMDDNLTQYIHVDEKKLRQILINILSNSIKYTDSGGVSFRIKSSNQTQKDTLMTFEIEDSGRGMSKEELKKIFDPFTQFSSSKGITEGTGLGLAITHRFLELMHAEIKVESEPNHGTIFSFSIPVRIANKNDIQGEVVQKKVIGMEKGSKIFKVLMIEDQKENRLLLYHILSSVGFDVYEASNGREGVEKFAKIKPDFIWMDMRMPVMNGYEATKEIRKLNKDVPIVALTASAFQEQKVEIIKAGCNDLLHKPYREYEIFQTMQKYLGIVYIYQDATPQIKKKSYITENKSISKIAPDLIQNLKNAIISLEPEKIIQGINAIQKVTPELSEYMLELAENYEYDVLLKLLEGKKDE